MTDHNVETTERKIVNLLIAIQAVRPNVFDYDYNELLPQERMFIELLGVVNGCGGKGSFIPVPNLHFVVCCNGHDWGYARGGTEVDRKKVDHKFLQAMLRVASAFSGMRRLVNTILAYDFFIAVRIFGRKFFNFINK